MMWLFILLGLVIYLENYGCQTIRPTDLPLRLLA